MLTKSAPLLLALLLMPTWVAAEPSHPGISFNGFGTLALTHSDETNADYVSDSLVAKRGVGHSGEWSTEVDSRLGLQASALLSQRLSAMVQLVAEQDHEGDYAPHVEWANLKFAITPDLDVRVGRMMLGAFISSEYRKVGYAMPWVRPPEEVYRIIPITYYDGMDLSYRFRWAETVHTLRASYGQFDVTSGGGYRVEAREGYALSHNLEWHDITLFSGYGRYRLNIDAFDPFFDSFRAFGPEGEAIADRYDLDGKTLEALGFGLRYDPGRWFAMGEWIRSDSRTLLGSIHGGYVTGGYRIGSVTPYVTLARADVTSETSDPGLAYTGLPEIDANISGLNSYLNQALALPMRQQRFSLGARWDVAANLALKAQYDHIDLDSGSAGSLVNLQSDFSPGGTVNLVSVALDFVF